MTVIKKAGLATGFDNQQTRITWRGCRYDPESGQQRQRQARQQRQRPERQRRRAWRQRQQQVLQQEREPEQRLQEPELQQEQQLLLFCHKQLQKRPAERPAEQSISSSSLKQKWITHTKKSVRDLILEIT
jgi:hypothetical protein